MNAVLRDLKEKDLSTIREWRNDPAINKFMFSQHTIGESEHQTWFEASLANPLRHLFVYEEDSELKGFMQFQQKSHESNVFEWGFYVSPDAPKGTGSKMAMAALERAFLHLGAEKVYGEALEFNEPSIRLHNRMGFVHEGTLRGHHYLNGEHYDIECFGLLKYEWMQHHELYNKSFIEKGQE